MVENAIYDDSQHKSVNKYNLQNRNINSRYLLFV